MALRATGAVAFFPITQHQLVGKPFSFGNGQATAIKQGKPMHHALDLSSIHGRAMWPAGPVWVSTSSSRWWGRWQGFRWCVCCFFGNVDFSNIGQNVPYRNYRNPFFTHRNRFCSFCRVASGVFPFFQPFKPAH
jgi:hypothetical protein